MLRVVISKIAGSNSKPSPSAPGRCRSIENRALHEPANGSTTPKLSRPNFSTSHDDLVPLGRNQQEVAIL
jgi:hypothetical protein